MNVKLVGERQDQSACIAVDSWDTWQAFASSSCPHLVTVQTGVLYFIVSCQCWATVIVLSQSTKFHRVVSFLLPVSAGRPSESLKQKRSTSMCEEYHLPFNSSIASYSLTSQLIFPLSGMYLWIIGRLLCARVADIKGTKELTVHLKGLFIVRAGLCLSGFSGRASS